MKRVKFHVQRELELFSQLLVIGGRVGVGKTQVGLSMNEYFMRNGYNSIYFGLEMSKEDVINRLIGLELVINVSDYIDEETDELNLPLNLKEKWDLILKNKYSKLNIVDDINLSLSSMRSLIIKSKAKIVFIDDLQLMFSMYGISIAELSSLCLELDITIVALSQLVREPSIGYILPRLSGGLEIEQYADKVFILDRDIINGIAKLDYNKHPFFNRNRYDFEFSYNTDSILNLDEFILNEFYKECKEVKFKENLIVKISSNYDFKISIPHLGVFDQKKVFFRIKRDSINDSIMSIIRLLSVCSLSKVQNDKEVCHVGFYNDSLQEAKEYVKYNMISKYENGCEIYFHCGGNAQVKIYLEPIID